jgi:hypothetical protein
MKVIARVTLAMTEGVNGIAGGFHDPGRFFDLQSLLIASVAAFSNPCGPGYGQCD